MKATVSGSFHQAMSAIESAVVELGELDVQVLSPADPRVVDAVGAFYFVGSDLVRSVKLVQDRHLAAIDTSDLLWLCAPNGYLGLSAAMEIGYAVRAGTPVFASELPTDLTLREYVTVVPQIRMALAACRGRTHPSNHALRLLLDPVAAISASHDDLGLLSDLLLTPGTTDFRQVEAAARRIRRRLR
jgi:hypothetical protein